MSNLVTAQAANELSQFTDPRSMVVLSPNDPQGRLILRGVFGHAVSIDERRGLVEVQLDRQLVECSAIFNSYAGGKTFQTSVDEAAIINAQSVDSIDSIKATLTAAMAQNWGKRYAAMMNGMPEQSFTYQALDQERSQALIGTQRLIDSKSVMPIQLSVSFLSMVDEAGQVQTEMAILKKPHSQNDSAQDISEENQGAAALFNDYVDGDNSPDALEVVSQQVLRQDAHLTVLVKSGVDMHDFIQALLQSSEAMTLIKENMDITLHGQPYTMGLSRTSQFLNKEVVNNSVNNAFIYTIEEISSPSVPSHSRETPF